MKRIACSFLWLVWGCLQLASAEEIPKFVNAVVSKTSLKTSLPTFSTIEDAIAHSKKSRNNDAASWTIFIKSGVYHERITLDANNLFLLGESRSDTIIKFGRYAGQAIDSILPDTWGTGRTATLEVLGNDIRIENLTVKNSFNFPANEVKASEDVSRVSGTQAVALKTGIQADRTHLKNVELWGYQDTLYIKGDRIFIEGGVIAGHIDFIFGEGTALFDTVTILSRARAKTMPSDTLSGYITAPSTNIHRPFGLTFVNCRLEREIGVNDNSVALGRPWHPTTSFSDGRYADPLAIGKTTFINTYMDAHIASQRWTSMSGKTPNGQKKFFSPKTEARFSEFGSFGPGAPVAEKNSEHSNKLIHFYSESAVLRGWLPALKQ